MPFTVLLQSARDLVAALPVDTRAAVQAHVILRGYYAPALKAGLERLCEQLQVGKLPINDLPTKMARGCLIFLFFFFPFPTLYDCVSNYRADSCSSRSAKEKAASVAQKRTSSYTRRHYWSLEALCYG